MLKSNRLSGPLLSRRNPPTGEVVRMLPQVAKAIENAWIAASRRPAGVVLRRQRGVDGTAEIAVGRDRLVDQRRQRQAVERLDIGGELGELGQDRTATL